MPDAPRPHIHKVMPPDPDRAKRIMAWLDEQPKEFRELVHRIGLNAACNRTGNVPPREVYFGQ